MRANAEDGRRREIWSYEVPLTNEGRSGASDQRLPGAGLRGWGREVFDDGVGHALRKQGVVHGIVGSGECTMVGLHRGLIKYEEI